MEIITWILVISILAILSYYLYKIGTANFDHFEQRGIPFIKPLPFIGTGLPILTRKISGIELIRNVCNKFPDAKIVGLFDRTYPVYLIKDPELIKQIAVKDFEYFIDRSLVIDETADPLLGNTLGALTGQKWKDMRATLSPAFTGSKMRQMFDLIPEIGVQMAEYFKNCSDEERVVEMKEVFGRFALDAIASTNFGVKIDSLKEKNNYFYTKVTSMLNVMSIATVFRFFIVFGFTKLAKFLDIRIIPKSKTLFFEDLIRETERTRRDKGIFRPDLIQMLMQIKDGQLIAHSENTEDDSIGFATVQETNLNQNTSKMNWSEQELMSQAFVFFLAGFESVSMVSSFVSYELATNPEVQQKLLEEVDRVNEKLQKEGKELTYEVLQTMKYMDMVISEGLRIWTPSETADRKCMKDYTITNDQGREIVIPKNSKVYFAIAGLHTLEKYFENPMKFNPDRFSEENKNKIVSGTYIPFGVGPRFCIGCRFALMETKAALFYILREFTFEVTEKTQIPLKFAKGVVQGTRSEKGIWLKLKPRF